MKYFQETTVWNAGYPVPNHTYYMADDRSKAVGYIPAGGSRFVKFSKPLAIDTRGRKFVVLPKKGEPDEVYFPKAATTKNIGIEVMGSGGKIYHLTKGGAGWRCTCPGYTFRHTCKHTASMEGK